MHLNPQAAFLVLVVMVRWATWLIEARASPLNPYVAMLLRSPNSRSLLVVNLLRMLFRKSLSTCMFFY